MEYIGHILENPNKEYSLLELDKLVNPGEIEVDSHIIQKVTKEELDSQFKANKDSVGYDNAIDEEAIKNYKNEIIKLKEELKSAEEADKLDLASTIDKKIAKIEKELKKSVNQYNKPIKVGNELEKIRKKIFNNIKYSQDKIAAKHISLGKHLKKTIKIGKFSRYNSKEPINWDVKL